MNDLCDLDINIYEAYDIFQLYSQLFYSKE